MTCTDTQDITFTASDGKRYYRRAGRNCRHCAAMKNGRINSKLCLELPECQQWSHGQVIQNIWKEVEA